MPIEPKNKNEKLTDELEEKQKPVDKGLVYTNEERDLMLFIKQRYDAMTQKKKDLGINYKCDLYDRLYTPHRVLKLKNIDKEFEQSHLQFDDEDGRNSNKSKPIAFEKIQTALAIMIKENPRAFMKPKGKKYKPLNEMIKAIYEDNWDTNRLIIELRKFVFHLAKYGIAYSRRYIKKEYKIIHNKDKDGNPKKERIVKFYDTIWETMHPKRILLDENCDNPRNARDLFIINNLSIQQVKDKYPAEKYSNVKYVERGKWLTEVDTDYLSAGNAVKKDELIEELIYEHENKDVKVIIVNGILLEEIPLPAHQLSVFGEKWADKDESYDGIGICQVLENYQPLMDEISNGDIDLVREIIKPTLYKSSALTLSDEQEDEVDGQRIVTFDGDIDRGLKWDRPSRTGDGREMVEALSREIDDATGITKDLSAMSDAKTLGQASYNRENSLRRLSLPLDAIKTAIEDDANKALPLFIIVNKSPINTYEIEDEKEKTEVQALIQANPNDERFVIMSNGKITRRQFNEIEINIDFNKKDKSFIQTDTQKFWELVPSSFDWKGKINIIPMSFIGESESLVQDGALQDLNILLGIQDTDPMGQPVLKDEEGKPYKVNKVKLIKDYLSARRKDAEDYIYELTPQNQGGDLSANPITNPANLQKTTGEKMGLPSTNEK